MALASSPVRAAQDDPRLNDLFDRLQTVEQPREIASLANQIWAIWHRYDGDASTVSTLLERGIAEMQARDFEAAEESFSNAIEADQSFAEAWNKRATLRYLAGDFRGSVLDIQRTLQLEPRHFGALSGLGMIYAQLEEWDLALKAYQQVLGIIPRDANAKRWVEVIEEKLANQEI